MSFPLKLFLRDIENVELHKGEPSTIKSLVAQVSFPIITE